jgi:hypothetical protein
MNAHTRLIGRTFRSLACGGALFLIAGCMEPAQRHDEFMSDQQETLSVDEVLERQAMAGAAADGTLNSSHFDGSGLNELGRTKLNAIIQHGNGPATVYVDVADAAPARVDAVTRYLKDAGASSNSIKVESGPNPKTTVAAVEGLKRMEKTESSEKDSRNERIIGVGVSNGTGSATEISK